MFRILVMNGLLISLILLWTSAAKEASKENLIKSTDKLPTEPLKIIPNILKWTSAAKEASKENLIKSTDKLPTDPLKIIPNILRWTSAAKEASKENLIKSTDKLPTEPLKILPNIPIWTSAAKETATENMIKSTEKLPTEPLKRTQNIPIWTSAAKESPTKNMIKSTEKLPTEPLKRIPNEPNKEMLSRKFSCGTELGGVCVYHKKSCPKSFPLDKPQGKPYCLKKHRCCYTDPTTAAPTTIVATTTNTEDPTTTDHTTIVATTTKTEDTNWGATINACISGNNYKVYQPMTIDICKAKCVEEETIKCQSIEYSSQLQMCSISQARSNSSDYKEPCSSDGWVFAEIELNTGSTTDGPATMAPNNSTNNGSTTDGPTTMAPNNSTNNGSTTDGPATMAPNNITNNDVSCNLVWTYEEDHPLIMIRETRVIVPPVDKNISDDPNRIPRAKKLVFACPGENNIFSNIEGNHTKLHGECILRDKMKVCVNGYPEIMDLSKLSCSSQIHPSIIKQDNDTSFKKGCEDLGGNLYKMGYIYGDYREFKDLDTNICFREEDQTTLWTSTNINRKDISPKIRSKFPGKFRTAQGKEAPAVWNDTICHNYGGHCVRGGTPCPEHLPHQTSQGEPFCNTFHRCCYLDQCNPTICTYKGQRGQCSLDALPGTTGVGSQECKNGCQCYIEDKNFVLRGLKNSKATVKVRKVARNSEERENRIIEKETSNKLKTIQERNEFSNILRAPCGVYVHADCSENNGYCDQICRGEPYSVTCHCFTGYALAVDGRTCHMEDCKVNKGGCQQRCKGNPGKIKCSCDKDYTLKDDGKTCGKNCVVTWGYELFKEVIEGEEVITWVSKHGGERPVILDEHNELIPPIKVKGNDEQRVPHGSKITFACSGPDNFFKDYTNEKTIHTECVEGNLQTQNGPNLEIKYMGCAKPIASKISPLPETDEDNSLCSGVLRRIEFEIFKNNPYPLIKLCYDTNKEITLWTKNMLNVEKNLAKYSPKNKPKVQLKWVTTPGFFTSADMNEIYYIPDQRIFFKESQPTFPNDFMEGEDKFFSKGHLVPKSDFVTKAEMQSTYNYLNALPQWQEYNGGNWATIEDVISKQLTANTNGAKIEIITGVSGTMKNKNEENVWLAEGPSRVPIPNIFWKVVIVTKEIRIKIETQVLKEAVVFVTNNNPLEDELKSPCQNTKCLQLKWISKKIKTDFENKLKGKTYCCKVSDLNNLKDFKDLQISDSALLVDLSKFNKKNGIKKSMG